MKIAGLAQAIWFALFYYLSSIGKVLHIKPATFHIQNRCSQLKHKL